MLQLFLFFFFVNRCRIEETRLFSTLWTGELSKFFFASVLLARRGGGSVK